MNLSKLFSPPVIREQAAVDAGKAEEPMQKVLKAMLGRDETTGNTYLKIPLPEARAMNRIVSGLGEMLSALSRQPLQP